MCTEPACPDREGAWTVSRRGFLVAAAAGAIQFQFGRLFGGLPGLLMAEEGAAPRGAARHCILLWLDGGPSQLDTFDPKPGRATGGPFQAIKTAAPQILLSEHFPRLAEQAKHLALVRSITSKEGSHERARYLVHTGYVPQGTVSHPSVGAMLSKEKGDEKLDLPNYVSIAGPSYGAGFLGASYAPFVVMDPARPVQNLRPPKQVPDDRLTRRLSLLRQLDKEFERKHPGEEAEGEAALKKKAERLMHSPRLKAFDVETEPQSVRDAYGKTPFGTGCLMARRLVEAGVACVEVALPGWDTHQDNFNRVKALSGTLDSAFAALVSDLARRNLLDKTLVVCMGEFGRTPKINGNDGRDHYPQAWSAALAGGGVRGGQAIGATDEDGAKVVDSPVAVPDLFATVYRAFGIDPAKVYDTPGGRPIKASDGGKPLERLFE